MEETELTSALPEPHQRYLAKYLEALRRSGVYSNQELFTQFPQRRLFEGYKDEPESRAKLLCANSSLPACYAEVYTVEECIRAFDLALTKFHEATPDKVFAVVTSDELVRIQDPVELYAFLDRTKWYEKDTTTHRGIMAALLASTSGRSSAAARRPRSWRSRTRSASTTTSNICRSR